MNKADKNQRIINLKLDINNRWKNTWLDINT